MKFPKLFSPGKIGPMTLKNRIVMPPMVRNYATTKGAVNSRYLAHIESIAKGGVGMMILEATFISPEGKGFTHELGIDKDNLIGGLKKLADIAHKHKAKIGVQLYHAGRQTHHNTTGKKPVAPSPIPCPLIQDPPKQLSSSQIIELENRYANAAMRAKEASMDFVEIHGAHGYLITQFLSSLSNKRKDKYGGSFTNRFRFLKNIVLKTKAVVGNDYPIIVRLSADELQDHGLKIKDTQQIAKELETLAVHALHISVGNYGSYTQGLLIPPMAIPEAVLVKYASSIKKVVKIPVITVGKIHYPELAEQILGKNQADFISIGRGLLADPEFPNKCQSGQLEDINHCISCNQGCITRLFAGQDVQCTINPFCSFELKLKFTKAKKPQKIAILGAGPAGLYCAFNLSNLGHSVTMYEKSKKLGGQLNLAEKTPFRQGITTFKNYLINQVKKSKVKIHLGKTIDLKNIKKINPDIVINATGSHAIIPPIKGIDHKNVILADKILSGNPKLKKKIIIIGGGCQGAQVADLLSSKKHQVTIIEMNQNIATEMPLAERNLLLERLQKNKVVIHANTKVLRIDKDGVVVKKGKGQTKIKSDQVVLCLGRHPNLESYINLKKLVKKIYNIGDSDQVSRINDAIRAAANTCAKIK
ncbi:NAD(P)/FAD-dependent oxidoreductase [Patescibacteria group bacterium]|nr:NAD(P)/FAD-dependent oxidoreductase [Patescibacteria group bacterium]